MSFFDKLFGRKKRATQHQHELFSPTAKDALKEFSTLSADSRMIQIMRMGDSKPVNPVHLKFFQYAILSDPDVDVKFAALKRVHFFKEDPAVISMMKELKEKNNYEDMEPYFSMALNRLGLISIEDFQKKIQGS